MAKVSYGLAYPERFYAYIGFGVGGCLYLFAFSGLPSL